MAGLMIAESDLTAKQVQCIFKKSEEFLPTTLASCDKVKPTRPAMSISFLGSTVDASGHRVSAKWSGNAAVTFSGAKFDGDDDYVTVSDFTYEKGDGKFTV